MHIVIAFSGEQTTNHIPVNRPYDMVRCPINSVGVKCALGILYVKELPAIVRSSDALAIEVILAFA